MQYFKKAAKMGLLKMHGFHGDTYVLLEGWAESRQESWLV